MELTNKIEKCFKNYGFEDYDGGFHIGDMVMPTGAFSDEIELGFVIDFKEDTQACIPEDTVNIPKKIIDTVNEIENKGKFELTLSPEEQTLVEYFKYYGDDHRDSEFNGRSYIFDNFTITEGKNKNGDVVTYLVYNEVHEYWLTLGELVSGKFSYLINMINNKSTKYIDLFKKYGSIKNDGAINYWQIGDIALIEIPTETPLYKFTKIIPSTGTFSRTWEVNDFSIVIGIKQTIIELLNENGQLNSYDYNEVIDDFGLDIKCIPNLWANWVMDYETKRIENPKRTIEYIAAAYYTKHILPLYDDTITWADCYVSKDRPYFHISNQKARGIKSYVIDLTEDYEGIVSEESLVKLIKKAMDCYLYENGKSETVTLVSQGKLKY